MVFGQLDQFSNFFEILQFYFEASLGSWSMAAYEGFDQSGNRIDTLYVIGVVFQCLFLLVNMVLFLNFVIAILSSTFAYYDNKQLGLYYEVIVALFPGMEYDEKFGALVCAQPPLNLLIFPFQWIQLLPLGENFLVWYNNFLCHIMYLPINLVLTMSFTVVNVIQMPFAYLIHTLALIKTLTDSDETMDDFSEKFQRFITIVKFILVGPIYLLLSIPVNAFVFFYNMYTIAHDTGDNQIQNVFSKESLEQFSLTCERTLMETRKETGDLKTNEVNFVRLNKALQRDLNI
jgi:hypothetical protein